MAVVNALFELEPVRPILRLLAIGILILDFLNNLLPGLSPGVFDRNVGPSNTSSQFGAVGCAALRRWSGRIA